MKRHMKPILVALALAGAFLLALSNVRAHDFYEMHCCNNRDCKPVSDGEVTQTPTGFIVDGVAIDRPDARIRKPINEQFHLCRHFQTGQLLCIYPKLQGF